MDNDTKYGLIERTKTTIFIHG